MNERTLTVKLMERTSGRFQGRAVVIKHADRYTRFIPDVQVLVLDKTSWVEMKLLRKGEALKDIVEVGQLIFGGQLSATCGGRAWIAVYEEDPQQTTIWSPLALGAHLYPSVITFKAGSKVYDATESWETRPGERQRAINLDGLVKMHGAIRCSGWSHDFVVQLLVDAIRRV